MVKTPQNKKIILVPKKKTVEKALFSDIKVLIEESKNHVAHTVNSTLTLLYWKIGRRINADILKYKRAQYGEQIVASLTRQLESAYGKGFEEKNIRRMMQFATIFSNERIVASLMRQLSWTHFTLLFPLKESLQREFYAEMCRVENWSVRTLRQKIDGMLYERTAISKKPKQPIKQELKQLRESDKLTPDLVFRDPYILDFLGLKNTFSEKHLEDAILSE